MSFLKNPIFWVTIFLTVLLFSQMICSAIVLDKINKTDDKIKTANGLDDVFKAGSGALVITFAIALLIYPTCYYAYGPSKSKSH